MGHVAGIGQTKRSYKIVIGKYERKRKPERPARRWIKKNQVQNRRVGRNSLGGIATYYALDGLGVESR
jgi:hypothetical protein